MSATTTNTTTSRQQQQPQHCVTVSDFDHYMTLRMRGLNIHVDGASQEADEKYYLRRMKEIIEEFPNKGPPFYPTRLTPQVYIGSQRNADDLTTLQRIGITHVLNCAGTRRFDLSRSPYPRDSGIKGYLMIPAEDHDEFNIMSYFGDAISFLDKAKCSAGRALIHCNLGVNRSGAICAAYLMVDQHMTLLEVIRFLKTKRSVVLYNKGFRRQLFRFARYKGLLDPVINTGVTSHESNPGSSRSRGSVEERKGKEEGKARAPKIQASGSLDSVGMNMGAPYQPQVRRRFGSRLFKRYGRSLSNSVVEEEIARHKPSTSKEGEDQGSNGSRSNGARSKEDDPGESRFARSFLTLPRRSSSSSNNNNNNKIPSQQMDPLPENLPVQNFRDTSSAAHKRRTYRERGGDSRLDRNDELLETYQDTGFSTTLLPGAKLRAKESADATDRGAAGKNGPPEDPESPKSLSTSRPLRVYKRSATDSEVYRSRRQAASGQGAEPRGEQPKTPRSPGSENNLDKLSRDMSAFTFDPLPMRARTASTPEQYVEQEGGGTRDGRIRPVSRMISAD